MSGYHAKYTVELPPFPGTLRKEKKEGRKEAYALTDEQVKWLRKALRKASSQQIGRMMGVSDTTVYRLAMNASAAVLSRFLKVAPFPGTLKRGRYNSIILTEEQIEWLREWYPKTENGIILHESGLSNTTLHVLAHKYGFKKSKEGMSAILRRNAKYVKKKLEGNGWYDMHRGKPLPEKCRQRAAEWRKEHGSPVLYMKENMPRLWKKRNEKLKKTVRKQCLMEHFRLLSGMKPQTRRHYVLTRYTRNQACRRTNALKRGYWFYADNSEQGGERWNIYWDEHTRRSALFEANSEKDGFHIKDGRKL